MKSFMVTFCYNEFQVALELSYHREVIIEGNLSFQEALDMAKSLNKTIKGE